MKQIKKLTLAVILCSIFLLLNCQQRTLASEHSITLGPSGLQIINLEYEKAVSEQITLNADYGISYMGIVSFSDEPSWPSLGMGINWYFKNQAIDGAYLGLHVTHVEPKGDTVWSDLDDIMAGGDSNSDDDDECSTFEYFTVSLGYKKVFGSGFTIDSAIQGIYIPESEGSGVLAKLAFGHSW